LLLAVLTVAAAAIAFWWNHEGQWIGVVFLIFAYVLVSVAAVFGDHIVRAIHSSAARVREAERRDQQT
jgi:hypothetical protein